MSILYTELLEKDFARQIRFLNIEKYHGLGYKGKGWTILNAEGVGDHREMTSKVVKDFAPEAMLCESLISVRTSGDKVLEASVTINGEKIDFEKAIDKYNIKIVTRSYAGSSPRAFLNYLKDIQKRKGVIFFCAAGNDGSDGVTGAWTKEDTAIAVGAAYFTEKEEIKLHNYSSRGEELDFISFLARGQGTSAASPSLAAQTVLLLQRYGDFTQEECVEILKSLCIRLPGFNNQEQGWGLPILPLTEKLEILERLRGENMADFKDIETDRWSKPAIDRCVNEGLLIGFEDGTFRPTEHVTREQFAQILTRILDKIERRI